MVWLSLFENSFLYLAMPEKAIHISSTELVAVSDVLFPLASSSLALFYSYVLFPVQDLLIFLHEYDAELTFL
jgi:hypothetical protein